MILQDRTLTPPDVRYDGYGHNLYSSQYSLLILKMDNEMDKMDNEMDKQNSQFI